MLLEPERDLRHADRCDEALFDGMFAQQFERPTDAACRRFGTSERHDLLALPRGERLGATAAGRIVQRVLNARLTEPLADGPHRSCGAIQLLCDLLVRAALIRLQKDLATTHYLRRSRSRTC